MPQSHESGLLWPPGPLEVSGPPNLSGPGATGAAKRDPVTVLFRRLGRTPVNSVAAPGGGHDDEPAGEAPPWY